MDGSQKPRQVVLVARARSLLSTIQIRQFRVTGIIQNPKFNVSIKTGYGPTHSTDFTWPQLLPPTGPSRSEVAYVERRSVSNPGSPPGVQSATNRATGRVKYYSTYRFFDGITLQNRFIHLQYSR